MVFEGKRFWDLRRHRMLNRIDGMHKYGIMTMKVEDRTYDQVTPDDVAKANKYEWLPEDFTYSVEELITTGQRQMSMPDKYYFFPIQLDNIDKDPNLEQNKDWGGTFNLSYRNQYEHYKGCSTMGQPFYNYMKTMLLINRKLFLPLIAVFLS